MTALVLAMSVALAAPDWSPDPPGSVMPDRHWDVEHLHLDLRIDPRRVGVSGTATHTVTPLGAPAGHLRLHQVELDIAEVRVDGSVVEGWRTRPGVLEIPMPVGGARHEVAVDWSAEPRTGLHWRGPQADRTVEVWSQGQDEDNRYWFPSWDYPNDLFTYSASIEAPEAFVALTNGALQGREAEAGRVRWSYKLNEPLPTYLVALAVGDYAVRIEEGPVLIETVVAASVDPAALGPVTGHTGAMVRWYGDLLGTPYPWPVYRQVFVQRFLFGAMENTTLTVTSDAFLVPVDGDRGARSEMVQAHELAHQWFGDLLTCYGWREVWLNEAFASYYAMRWQAHTQGPAYEAHEIARWHEHAYKERVPLAVRPWSRVEDADSAGPGTLYTRGGLVLHGLREALGHDVFDAAIATYVADNQHRLVESSDLRRALEDASGTHLGWLFDTWVFGTAFPSAATRWAWDDGVLTVAIEQEGDLRAPVDIEIGTASGPRTHRVWLGPGRTELVTELDEAPLWVAVDPRGAVIAQWKHRQEPAAWAAQLRHAPALYARLVAADHLGDLGGEDAVAALADAMMPADVSGHYRAHFAKALGAIGSPQAVDALIAALQDSSATLRHAVVDALGEVPPEARVKRVLEDLFHGDDDAWVRAAALEALAEHDVARALWIARRRAAAPDRSLGAWELTAATQVLGAHGELADVKRLVALTAPAVPERARHAAISAAPDLLERLPDEQKQQTLSRRLEPLLEDRDLRVQMDAIRALGKIGDDAAARRLDAWALDNPVPWLRDAAQAAADAIRQGTSDPAPAGDDRATEVERRLKALEERIERLEEWRF